MFRHQRFPASPVRICRLNFDPETLSAFLDSSARRGGLYATVAVVDSEIHDELWSTVSSDNFWILVSTRVEEMPIILEATRSSYAQYIAHEVGAQLLCIGIRRALAISVDPEVCGEPWHIERRSCLLDYFGLDPQDVSKFTRPELCEACLSLIEVAQVDDARVASCIAIAEWARRRSWLQIRKELLSDPALLLGLGGLIGTAGSYVTSNVSWLTFSLVLIPRAGHKPRPRVHEATLVDGTHFINQAAWDVAHHERSLVPSSGSKHALPRYVLDLLGTRPHRVLLQPLCGNGDELIAAATSLATTQAVGVDYAATAISSAASRPNTEGCEFIQAEVDDYLGAVHKTSFDSAFTTIGSLWWIADLERYLRHLRRIVREQYVIWDFHPFCYMINDDLQIVDDYPLSPDSRRYEEGLERYWNAPGAGAARSTMGIPVVEYRWSLSSLVNLALAAGWAIGTFEELPHVFGEHYLPCLHEEQGDNTFRLPAERPQVPLTFVLQLKAV